MRRNVLFAALVTALAYAAPVSAQVPSASQKPSWHLGAVIGSSFANIGTTPTAMTSIGYRVNPHLSWIGEAGTFRRAPFEKASAVAPTLNVPTQPSDLRVNAYHFNANLAWQLPARTVQPYLTAGVGGFTSATVSPNALGVPGTSAYRRQTHSAMNVGAGLRVPVTSWLGATADYRRFVLSTNDAPRVDRLTVGVSLSLK